MLLTYSLSLNPSYGSYKFFERSFRYSEVFFMWFACSYTIDLHTILSVLIFVIKRAVGLISAITTIIRKWWANNSSIIRIVLRTNISEATIAKFNGIFIENLEHFM